MPLTPFWPAAPGTRPLQALTVLVVEDSRYASDALRLLCQRFGARVRRADSLAAADAHLATYRPDLLIIDLGLPDGRGESLIRRLTQTPRPRPVVLATSGDPDGRFDALDAGADGFLEKPLTDLNGVLRLILQLLPDRADAALTWPDPPPLIPDPLALRDDLTRAAALIDAGPDAALRRYLLGLLGSLGHSAGDSGLTEAAVLAARDDDLAPLSHLLHSRIRPVVWA
jgi:CheY-like chemotaxis protein